MSFLLQGEKFRCMEKKLTNSDPFRKSTDKHSIYTHSRSRKSPCISITMSARPCPENSQGNGGGNGRHGRLLSITSALGYQQASVRRHMVPANGHIHRLDRCLIDNLTITHHQDTVREG